MTENMYKKVDSINEYIYATAAVDEETIINGKVCSIPDFDKPNEDKRLITLKLIPDSGEYAEITNVPGDLSFKRRGTHTHCTYLSFSYWQKLHLCVGDFLRRMEQHGQDPDVVLEETPEKYDTLIERYREWESNLDSESRKKILQSLAAEQFQIFKRGEVINPRYLQWEKTFNLGNWRSTDLPPEDQERVLDATEKTEDLDGCSCYYTTLQVYQRLWDDPDVEYCEGITLPEKTGIPIEHAWLEIEGEVAEITWPYHRPDAGEAVYYGTSIPRENIEKRMEQRGCGTTMLLDPDEYDHRGRLYKNQSSHAGSFSPSPKFAKSLLEGVS